MSEGELDARQIERKVHDLAEAMERVRNDQASRDDVVVDLREASRTRLEMLAQDLQSLFQDLPDDNDQFEFALTNGEPPRLWIDMTSFVRMGRDKRTYEFIKDTRMGRSVLGRSDDRERIGRMISNYVAERVLERERMIEGEWVSMRDYDFSGEGGQGEVATVKEAGGMNFWKVAILFLLGVVAGAAGMITWAWFFNPPGVM